MRGTKDYDGPSGMAHTREGLVDHFGICDRKLALALLRLVGITLGCEVLFGSTAPVGSAALGATTSSTSSACIFASPIVGAITSTTLSTGHNSVNLLFYRPNLLGDFSVRQNDFVNLLNDWLRHLVFQVLWLILGLGLLHFGRLGVFVLLMNLDLAR